MIGLLTNSQRNELAGMVRRVVAQVAPNEPFEIVNIERRQDSEVLRSRDFASQVLSMKACILDCDVGHFVSYAAELGSLAVGLMDQFGQRSSFNDSVSELDKRVLLVTRETRTVSRVARFFGEYYTVLSLADVNRVEAENVVADWLRDTLDRSQPRVFISYRSSQRPFARKVASSLKRHGAAVWFDELHVVPGDSIPDAINRGLGWCTHMVLIVDQTFFESDWTKAEYESVLYRRLSGTRTRYSSMPAAQRAVIPLYLVDPVSSEMPPMLARIRGIDCRGRTHRSVMNQLWSSISSVGPR